MPANKPFPVIYVIDGSVARTGAFIGARNIARALNGRANVVLILAKNSEITGKETQVFAAVRRLPIRPLRRSFAAIILYLPYLLITSILLRYYMWRDGACSIIVNDFYLMHGAFCRCLAFRGPIYTWIRINPATFGPIAKIWLWAVRKTSTRIIVVSRYINSLLPANMTTDLIYDAIDPQFEGNPSPDPDTSRTFIYIGNYISGKGQDIAIEAIASVSKEFPDVRLEFYGGDMGLEKNREFRRSLEERAKFLGVDHHLYFGDFAPNPQQLLAGKFAAINLSRSESFSLTVLEASASSLPVIATRCGGPEEIIENERTGLLIPLDDPTACAAAMLQLCRDPAIASRMGQEGRRRVQELFSATAFQQNISRMLEL